MERRIRKEVVVEGTIEEVFRAWTTAEGAVTFFAPRASIEPRIGGAYELYFDDEQPEGSRGSEGCAFVSLEAPHRFAVTWNAPPKWPALRNEHTKVAVELRSEGDRRTHVTVVHDGFGDGTAKVAEQSLAKRDDWGEVHAYFERAWGIVVERLQRRFAKGPIDWRED